MRIIIVNGLSTGLVLGFEVLDGVFILHLSFISIYFQKIKL